MKLNVRVPAAPRKTLVIFPGALGDFLCFLPALHVLARNGAVDLYARTEFAGLLPARITARSLERYEISRLFAPGADRDPRVRRFFSAYVTVWSWMGSRERTFADQLSALCEDRARLFPFRPDGSAGHIRDFYLACVGGVPSAPIAPTIPIRADALSWRRNFWRARRLRGKNVLALAPGSGAREKNWPAEFYKAIAEWWTVRLRNEVLILLGPVEEENALSAGFWQPSQIVRGLSLAQLAALLDACDLYLGNDSGITHLAAMLGVATVALFGPTDPEQWAPHGDRVTLVTRAVECSPCAASLMRACPHRKCLTAMPASGVAQVLQETWKKASTRYKFSSLTRGGAEIKVQH